jgi:hypothetical protein
MGGIKVRKDSVIVEFDISELLDQPAYVHLPEPTTKEMILVSRIGSMIGRVARRILHEKKRDRQWDRWEIRGTGTVTVTFYEEEL